MRGHRMETFSALQALCAGNSPVTVEFPAQRPVTRGFDVFWNLRLNNGWVNNREAGDLRHYRAHYDVTVKTELTLLSCRIISNLLHRARQYLCHACSVPNYKLFDNWNGCFGRTGFFFTRFEFRMSFLGRISYLAIASRKMIWTSSRTNVFATHHHLYLYNSLRPSDPYMRHQRRLSFVQITTFCLAGGKTLSESMLEYC